MRNDFVFLFGSVNIALKFIFYLLLFCFFFCSVMRSVENVVLLLSVFLLSLSRVKIRRYNRKERRKRC